MPLFFKLKLYDLWVMVYKSVELEIMFKWYSTIVVSFNEPQDILELWFHHPINLTENLKR